MRAAILTGLLAISSTIGTVAKAQPAEPPQGVERFEARRVEKISQALGLDAAGAAALKTSFDGFEAQVKPLHQQIRASVEIVRRAAQGEAAAQSQLDSALAQIRSLRGQVTAVRQQLFDSISQGRTAQQKAQLALLMAPGKGMHGRHAWR